MSSYATPIYNCLGWALNSDEDGIWPQADDELTTAGNNWPADLPSTPTVETFTLFLARHGYSPCDDEEHEPGTEKLALYALENGEIQHVARQLRDGTWTSKMGQNGMDVHHKRAEHLECEAYGAIVAYFCRDWVEGTSGKRGPIPVEWFS